MLDNAFAAANDVLVNSIEACLQAHISNGKPESGLVRFGWTHATLKELAALERVRNEALGLPVLALKGSVGIDPSADHTPKLIEKVRQLYFVQAQEIKEYFDNHNGSYVFVNTSFPKTLAEVVNFDTSRWRCTFYGSNPSAALEALAKFTDGVFETPTTISAMKNETSGLDFQLSLTTPNPEPIGARFVIANPSWIERSDSAPFEGQFLIKTQSSPEWLKKMSKK